MLHAANGSTCISHEICHLHRLQMELQSGGVYVVLSLGVD
jgi:hypothetical protein